MAFSTRAPSARVSCARSAANPDATPAARAISLTPAARACGPAASTTCAIRVRTISHSVAVCIVQNMIGIAIHLVSKVED